jgi:hypothetical protein
MQPYQRTLGHVTHPANTAAAAAAAAAVSLQVQGKRWKVDLNSRQEASLLLSAVNLPGGVQVSHCCCCCCCCQVSHKWHQQHCLPARTALKQHIWTCLRCRCKYAAFVLCHAVLCCAVSCCAVSCSVAALLRTSSTCARCSGRVTSSA